MFSTKIYETLLKRQTAAQKKADKEWVRYLNGKLTTAEILSILKDTQLDAERTLKLRDKEEREELYTYYTEHNEYIELLITKAEGDI